MSIEQSVKEGDAEWDKLHSLIGRIVVVTNSAHWCVFEMMGILLNTSREDTTPIYYSLKADAAQRDLTKAIATDVLADSRESDLLARVNSAIDELGKAAGIRNAFIHSHWTMEHSSEGRKWTCAGKPHPKLDLKNPLKQAEVHIKHVNELIGQLLALCDELEHTPSVEKRIARTGMRRK